MENKDLNCIVITVAFSYSGAPTVRLSWKYRDRGFILNHYTHSHTQTLTHSDTPTLTAHFGSPPSDGELQVWRVCEPTGKQGLGE